ncbi:MAG TPA: protein kinase [Kofleriaceae bacterium]|nr:protein kinase [Kofleriaceae bacterium]
MTPGQLLEDRFELGDRIGTGGMGEVFRGHDRASGEAVAIKVISVQAVQRAHGPARFAREVQVLAELDHPGIVRYIAHGETPAGELFLVMEWLEGEDLQARLARAPLTPGDAVTLAKRVAAALAAAHTRKIVHRDLKPRNIFLPGGQVDRVKVLDFGIAQRGGQAPVTQTGGLVGTPGFMAPEQASSGATPVDARADVFALGCVLFLCLTGSHAFEGDSTAAVLAKLLFGEAPRVSTLWPEVPADLDALIAQMLSRAPSHRPRDGANLVSALAALAPMDAPAPRVSVAPRRRLTKPVAVVGSERRFGAAVLLARDARDADTAPSDDALRAAVKRYGGRLEQRGDGSTLVVLEPERPEATDQATQAARCALALRALTRGRPMAVAMGRGEPASQLPARDVIEEAARLLARLPAAPGALAPIVLDEVSAGLLDARFDIVERDAGLMLCGERTLALGARTLLGRPTSCVGRDWELGALTGLLDGCIEEHEARVAIVTAAAGMGKSRIAAELVSRAPERVSKHDQTVAIWVGRGDSLRAGSTLDLLAQALRGALRITGAEPLAERREKIRLRVAEHVPEREQQRVAELLGELVGTPFPGGADGSALLEAARQDTRLMSEQMQRAWLDFLQAETSAHPVLIVLEDLQWGDFGTVRFIDAALRERGKQPWMVLALARPEVFEVFPKLWADRRNVQEIRLRELGRKAGERLVRQVLGDRIEPETIERLVARADGNAFYLEELIRAAAEGSDALPETVLAMVETRLARLPAEARTVLRAASVFGEACWEDGVVALLGGAIGAAGVSELCTRLVAQEVLAVRPESRFPGERELVFRHALLREGAYATLTDGDRRTEHRRAGEWLEQHGEADPMVLAGHFERGDERARAAHYYLRAAEQAFQVHDLQSMVHRAALGLACAPSAELRLALLGMRCEASIYAVHLLGTVQADAAELLRGAPPGSRPWAQAVFPYLVGLTMAGKTTGRMSELPAVVESLRAAVPAPDALQALAVAYIGVISMLDTRGQLPAGTALAERLGELLGPAEERTPHTQLWWCFAVGIRAAYAHEDPWLGLLRSEEMWAIHALRGGERLFVIMHVFGGMNLWFLGAYARAEQTLRAIPSADESMGSSGALRRFCLAWVLADRGELADAQGLAAALAEDERGRIRQDEGRARWVLAEVLRRRGDLDAADRELDAALERLGPLEQAAALGTRAALRLAQGRAEDARAVAEDAVARCAAMGGCGMFRGALVRLAHAEALHATGARAAAREAITEARARLLAIADRIGDPEYRRSFLEEVPENARTLALARAWERDA